MVASFRSFTSRWRAGWPGSGHVARPVPPGNSGRRVRRGGVRPGSGKCREASGGGLGGLGRAACDAGAAPAQPAFPQGRGNPHGLTSAGRQCGRVLSDLRPGWRFEPPPPGSLSGDDEARRHRASGGSEQDRSRTGSARGHGGGATRRARGSRSGGERGAWRPDRRARAFSATSDGHETTQSVRAVHVECDRG